MQGLPYPVAGAEPPPFVDTTGDNNLFPDDVLLIVNYLNGSVGAEGEERSAVDSLTGDARPGYPSARRESPMREPFSRGRQALAQPVARPIIDGSLAEVFARIGESEDDVFSIRSRHQGDVEDLLDDVGFDAIEE